jgi:hypothetical protein
MTLTDVCLRQRASTARYFVRISRSHQSVIRLARLFDSRAGARGYPENISCWRHVRIELYRASSEACGPVFAYQTGHWTDREFVESSMQRKPFT